MPPNPNCTSVSPGSLGLDARFDEAFADYACEFTIAGYGGIVRRTGDAAQSRVLTFKPADQTLRTFLFFPDTVFVDDSEQEVLRITCPSTLRRSSFVIAGRDGPVGTIHRRGFLGITYHIACSGRNWTLALTPFTRNYFAISRDGLRVGIRGALKRWYIRGPASLDDITFIAALAFIHRGAFG